MKIYSEMYFTAESAEAKCTLFPIRAKQMAKEAIPMNAGEPTISMGGNAKKTISGKKPWKVMWQSRSKKDTVVW